MQATARKGYSARVAGRWGQGVERGDMSPLGALLFQVPPPAIRDRDDSIKRLKNLQPSMDVEYVVEEEEHLNIMLAQL